MAFVLDVMPSRAALDGTHRRQNPARTFDVGAIEERAVEREQATGLQHAANLTQHGQLVFHEMDRVETRRCRRI
jgi:hypothetical protein